MDNPNNNVIRYPNEKVYSGLLQYFVKAIVKVGLMCLIK